MSFSGTLPDPYDTRSYRACTARHLRNRVLQLPQNSICLTADTDQDFQPTKGMAPHCQVQGPSQSEFQGRYPGLLACLKSA